MSSMVIFLTWPPSIPSKCFILASWYNDLFLPNLFLISLKIFFLLNTALCYFFVMNLKAPLKSFLEVAPL